MMASSPFSSCEARAIFTRYWRDAFAALHHPREHRWRQRGILGHDAPPACDEGSSSELLRSRPTPGWRAGGDARPAGSQPPTWGGRRRRPAATAAPAWQRRPQCRSSTSTSTRLARRPAADHSTSAAVAARLLWSAAAAVAWAWACASSTSRNRSTAATARSPNVPTNHWLTWAPPNRRTGLPARRPRLYTATG